MIFEICFTQKALKDIEKIKKSGNCKSADGHYNE